MFLALFFGKLASKETIPLTKKKAGTAKRKSLPDRRSLKMPRLGPGPRGGIAHVEIKKIRRCLLGPRLAREKIVDEAQLR